jgi:hypothetical protein
VLAGFALYYPALIAREEAKLRQRFGPAYERWRRTTPALLPRLNAPALSVNPPARTVDPRAVARQAFDALRVVLALGLLQAIEELHRGGYLPVWWHVY